MDKNLQVVVKNVYGNDLIYPACNTTKIITELTGTKTLVPYQINILKKNGYNFEIITEKTSL
jgi:hypothetical protein